MRRFSQRNALVTLSEINITPLLDLAFVLLIIFIITTPLLERSIELKLPEGGAPDRKILKEDIRTVEITPDGQYRLEGKPIRIDDMEGRLVQDHKSNPNLIVYIRADEMGLNKHLYTVLDRCQRNGIKFGLRTKTPVQPTAKR
jgi:biopolymer transport protein ExbD